MSLKSIFFVIAIVLAALLAPQAFAATAPLKITTVQAEIKDFTAISKDVASLASKCSKKKQDSAFKTCMTQVIEASLVRRDQNDGTKGRLFALHFYRMEENIRADILSSVSLGAIERINNANLSLDQRASSVEILKNLISEVDPAKLDQRASVQKIADSNLQIPEEVKEFRETRLMAKTPNLVELSKTALLKPAEAAVAPNAPVAELNPEAKLPQNAIVED